MFHLKKRNAKGQPDIQSMGIMGSQDQREVRITIKGQDGQAFELHFSMPDEALRDLEAIAEKRGETLVDVFVEALSLRRLFAEIQDSDDQSLIIKKGNDYQELVAI